MTDIANAGFAVRLLEWFDRHGRHDLPWQHPRTPYRVWLSEVMLQQTQVQVVVPYFERFVADLPDVTALAHAPLDQVLSLWSGLGYYARARNLHAAAKLCSERHGGELPRDLDALVALPGIGRSTAGAIAAQALGVRAPILDGNVKRVLARLHGIEGWPGAPSVEKRLWALAHAHLDEPGLADKRLPDYTQAQMDLGATLCTRREPNCNACPLRDRCVALRDGRVTELPAPKPGRPLPERSALVLLLHDAAGNLLLQRRPPTGIWGGLWSLPEFTDAAAARDWFDGQLDGDFDRGTPLPAVAHGFTHFRLQLRPLRWRGVAPRATVRDNDDLRWTPPAAVGSLGLPAPIRRLLQPLP